MGWFSNWLLKVTEKARQNRDENDIKAFSIESPNDREDFGRALNISVYNAHGGKIVTFRSYDKHQDRSNEATYIVHPDEEFSESLGKLIAMEEIKHAGR